MSAERDAQLDAIAERIRACKECRLHEQATNAVPGYGNVHADILFIGEAPGYNEDQQGLPFVGKSGRYLDYLLDLIGMKRDEVFIANMVKHRPPDNRDPHADEIEACKHFLDEQFAVIDPLVVATLGRFSMEYYLGKRNKITKVHGQPVYREGRAYYPLYHPAAALRNPALRWDMETDIKRIPEVVADVRRRREEGAAPPDDSAPPPTDEPPEQLNLF
jgi:uracil-DNA glycosylase